LVTSYQNIWQQLHSGRMDNIEIYRVIAQLLSWVADSLYLDNTEGCNSDDKSWKQGQTLVRITK